MADRPAPDAQKQSRGSGVAGPLRPGFHPERTEPTGPGARGQSRSSTAVFVCEEAGGVDDVCYARVYCCGFPQRRGN